MSNDFKHIILISKLFEGEVWGDKRVAYDIDELRNMFSSDEEFARIQQPLSYVMFLSPYNSSVPFTAAFHNKACFFFNITGIKEQLVEEKIEYLKVFAATS